MSTLPSEITNKYFLTAGETDAEGRMPLPLIVTRLIEVATDHANILGVGYDTLKLHGIGWVLSRFSVEMKRYPGINEPYSMTTWIEDYNRLYSDRCFCITDAQGDVVGNIRSMWVAIDMVKRTAADLNVLDRSNFVVSDRRSPVGRPAKQPALGDEDPQTEYTFKYCDIDFNRHVNTVQYIKHILNQWPMEQYDRNMISRFDITFHNECLYGETVKIRHRDADPSLSYCDIVDPQGRRAVTATIHWRAST